MTRPRAAVAALQDKRQQLLNELRLMCDGSTNNVRGVVAYIGTYFVPEHNTARLTAVRLRMIMRAPPQPCALALMRCAACPAVPRSTWRWSLWTAVR
jgi:hypothetical protein